MNISISSAPLRGSLPLGFLPLDNEGTEGSGRGERPSSSPSATRNRLFAQYVEPRLATIRRSVEIMTFAGEDADDNFQNVLLHLLQVIHRYDPAQAAPSTWVSRVVTNFMNDLHDRSASRRRREPDVLRYDDDEDNDALCYDDDNDDDALRYDNDDDALRYDNDDDNDNDNDNDDADNIVFIEAGVRPEDFPTTYGALMQLSPQRRGILLRHVAGHSVAEIAAALNCSPGSVSTTLHRAKAQMKQLIVSTLTENKRVRGYAD